MFFFYLKEYPRKGANGFSAFIFSKGLQPGNPIVKRKYFTICKKGPMFQNLASNKTFSSFYLNPMLTFYLAPQCFIPGFCNVLEMFPDREPLFLFAFYLCSFPGRFLVFMLIIYDPNFFVPSFTVFTTKRKDN